MTRKPKRTHNDALKPMPIPPLSVVRVSVNVRDRSFRNQIGAVFRVGYYSKADGLDCIWLVNDAGHYEQTIDHKFLYRNFDIIYVADHSNWYGHRRPKIAPIRPAKPRPS